MKYWGFIFLILLSGVVFADQCSDLNTHSTWNELGGCAASQSQTTGITPEVYLLFLYLFGLFAVLINDFNASMWYVVYATVSYIGILIAPGEFAMSLFASCLIIAGFFVFRFIQKITK